MVFFTFMGTDKTSRKRTNRSTVVAFRVTPDEETRMSQFIHGRTILGVNSPHQFARKVVEDFLGGRLVYLRQEDLRMDNTIRTATEALSPS